MFDLFKIIYFRCLLPDILYAQSVAKCLYNKREWNEFLDEANAFRKAYGI